jgi:hypothetical protein
MINFNELKIGDKLFFDYKYLRYTAIILEVDNDGIYIKWNDENNRQFWDKNSLDLFNYYP